VSDGEDALTAEIVRLASAYGRYGYRRISALLRRDSWAVNVKRVHRITTARASACGRADPTTSGPTGLQATRSGTSCRIARTTDNRSGC
jgi:hypothetical protein